MAVAFVQVTTGWQTTTAGAASENFTPNVGDTIIPLAVQGATGGSFTFSGTGTYSQIAAAAISNDEQGDCWAAAQNSAASGVSQAVTVANSATTGVAWVLDYSGVGSVAASYTTPQAPGAGTGAILGNSEVVPVGAVLVALCADTGASSGPAITSPSGTNRASSTSYGVTYCITEYAGTGAAIQPSFTSTNGASSGFVVEQFLLSPTGSPTVPVPPPNQFRFSAVAPLVPLAWIIARRQRLAWYQQDKKSRLFLPSWVRKR
jgi:hypothetical protein